MAKKGPKMAVFFALEGQILRNQNKALTFSYFYPRGCIPNFRKFGSSDLEKMRYERTDKRTDGTEIIGPSGKIPGTNKIGGR